jgi:hypothetical protein
MIGLTLPSEVACDDISYIVKQITSPSLSNSKKIGMIFNRLVKSYQEYGFVEEDSTLPFIKQLELFGDTGN